VPIGHNVNANISIVTGMSCHANETEAIRRGLDGFRFFGYSLGYYALFGEHRPGRADLWERFLQVKDQLPENAGRGGIGTPDQYVDTPEQAREIVDHLKHPPIGHRSVAGSQAIFDFKSVPIGELTRAANAALLVIPMMETPTAIANAEAIAAVPGIDALLIGTNDLAAEMGIPGDFGHQRIAGAYETVIAACRKHNKWPGMAGVYVEELMQKYIGMGMRLVLAGSDGAFLMAGASRRAALVREWGGGKA